MDMLNYIAKVKVHFILILWFGVWHLREEKEALNPTYILPLLDSLLPHLQSIRDIEFLIILGSIHPVSDNKGHFAFLQSPSNTQKLNSYVLHMCNKYNVPFFNTYNLTKNANPQHFPDGTHPDETVSLWIGAILLHVLLHL